MKVTVVPAYVGQKHTVKLTQGVQSFHLDYQGTKTDCLWYAKMFRTALRNHDAAVAQSVERLPCKQDVGSSNLSSGSNPLQLHGASL